MMTKVNTTPITMQQFRPRRFHPQRPTVRTTFQLAGRLQTTDEHSTEQKVWDNAIRSALGWLRPRCPEEIPDQAWEGSGFECSVAGNRVDCVAIPSDGIWSLRLTHPDMPHGDTEAVPGRHWTTDLALRRSDEGIAFGVRVFCTSQAYSDAEIALTRPKVVRFYAGSFGLSHIRPLDGRVWYLNDEASLEEFEQFLLSDERLLPVFLLTEADQRRVPGNVSRYLLDERELAELTLGLAHVAVLPRNVSFDWSNRVGRTWSAFGGAVRTYRPGLNFEEDMPTEHPLALPENIVFWRHKDLSGERAFTAFLIDQAYTDAATRRMDWGNLIFFADAITRQAEIAREEATEDADWKSLYEEVIRALQAKVQEAQGERDEFVNLAEEAERTRDYYIAENDRLRWQIDSLQARLREKSGEEVDSGIGYPTDYSTLATWVEENLAGRVVLHSRALRGIKGAEFEDLQLLCDSLLLLANEYRRMRIGHDGAKDAFDGRLAALGLRCDGSITRTRAGEFGNTYFVRYPPHQSTKQFIDMHLRNNANTRDPKRCLAIYFFWDSETRQVVVASLPSHLNIRAS